MVQAASTIDRKSTTTTARCYFDYISPFAYLQLPRVLALCERIDITPVPIVLGALLAYHGQLSPAETPGKRVFTCRFVQWQANRAGIPLHFPPAHPFNPLAALRLCVAAGVISGDEYDLLNEAREAREARDEVIAVDAFDPETYKTLH